ncbi:MAG: hypothetical protein ACJ790_07850 [Myxococcaceae bacterium]
MRRLILVSVVALGACTKEAPVEKYQTDAATEAQAAKPIEGCDGFGQTVRALAFRKAARDIKDEVGGQPEASRTKCLNEWGAALDKVGGGFWMKIDCAQADTKHLVELWNATKAEDRADPMKFPEHGDDALNAFNNAAQPVVDEAAGEIVRRARAAGSGECFAAK